MSTFDYNPDSYTITELLAILDLDDPDEQEVMDSTNQFIDKFTNENRPEMVLFFQKIQTKLLQYMSQLDTSGEDAEYTPDNAQTDEWYKYEALPQKDNTVQSDKITDRMQKVQIYDDGHMPMNREQLGVNNNFNVDVAQDSLNPNLENITSRFINLDSQFRQAAGGIDTLSTDFTLDLSDPLTNVLSLRLYSIQVPYTWYVIDTQYGNTCFWVTNASNTFRIFLEPGNYTSDTFTIALNLAFVSAANYAPNFIQGFTYNGSVVPEPPIVTFNKINGKITINLSDWNDPSGTPLNTISVNSTFNAETDAYFTFFDFSGRLTCFTEGYGCAVQNLSFNGTLGWLMGFRLPIVPVNSTPGNVAVAVLDLYGSKYFILVLDDYNQNHINNGLITITELSTKLAVPSYYNSTYPHTCTANVANIPEILSANSSGNLAALTAAEAAALGTSPINVFNSIQDKLDISYGQREILLPSAPRILTQAQIYTINEIIKNRSRNTSYRGKAPTNSDTFALIPIKKGGLSTGDMYIEFSGGLQDNKRIYFGPVDIDRMKIKLLDDRGLVVDLHGADWCITLISDNLYQY
jgi:hypothetical protein